MTIGSFQVDGRELRALRDMLARPGDVLFLATCRIGMIEADFEVEVVQQVHPLHELVLRAIDLPDGRSLGGLSGLLHLPRQFVRQIVSELAASQQVNLNPNGDLLLSNVGRQTLQSGKQQERVRQRRTVFFLGKPNRFLSLRPPDPRNADRVFRDLSSKNAGADWQFDQAELEHCCRQLPEWKARHGFPQDIVGLTNNSGGAIPGTGAPPPTNPAQPIAVKLTEVDLVLRVVFVNGQPGTLNALPVSRNGHLTAKARGNRYLSLFDLNDSQLIHETFPDVLRAPDEEEIRAAWDQFTSARMKSVVGPSQPRVQDGRLEVAISAEAIRRSPSDFRRLLVEAPIISIRTDTMQRLYPLDLVGADETANGQLRALLRLEEWNDCDRETVNDRATELGENGRRNLADLAWQTAWEAKHFRLAYYLAEIEDMADADV